jgi:peptidoglycan/LPS O-acetylase OafA/YrhL
MGALWYIALTAVATVAVAFTSYSLIEQRYFSGRRPRIGAQTVAYLICRSRITKPPLRRFFTPKDLAASRPPLVAFLLPGWIPLHE